LRRAGYVAFPLQLAPNGVAFDPKPLTAQLLVLALVVY